MATDSLPPLSVTNGFSVTFHVTASITRIIGSDDLQAKHANLFSDAQFWTCPIASGHCRECHCRIRKVNLEFSSNSPIQRLLDIHFANRPPRRPHLHGDSHHARYASRKSTSMSRNATHIWTYGIW